VKGTVLIEKMQGAEGYQALSRGAVLFDRSDRMRMRVAGAKAPELVNGMVTSDVASLTPGRGQYSAALTAKGKIIADPRIFLTADGILVDVGAAAAQGWRDMVAKYVNPRVAPYSDVTAETRDIAVAGGNSAPIVAAVLKVDVAALKSLDPFSHLQLAFEDATIMVVRTPEIAAECYDVICPVSVADSLRAGFLSAGAEPGGKDLWTVLRIEAGRPEWGSDMNETTLPQEALLDELGAISFTKGCYIGQEVVARIHFRGHVNKLLRKLRFVTSSLPQRGAAVVDDSGAVVGDVRSIAISPKCGGIALGMIRREVEPGSTLHARWDGGEASVQIAGEKKGATA
jgi:tRNA-modifying protein YgfZ